jgi:uncharacterized protein (TIGR03437 family)
MPGQERNHAVTALAAAILMARLVCAAPQGVEAQIATAAPADSPPVVVTQCQYLNTAGNYTLTTDLACGAVSFSIGSNIRLDCGGHAMSFSTIAGLIVDGNSSTVDSCVIAGTTYVNSTSQGAQVSKCTLGNVQLSGAQGAVLANNTITGTVRLSGLQGAELANNTINGSVTLDQVSGVSVQGNAISVPASSFAIYATGGGSNNSFLNNSITGGAYGIYFLNYSSTYTLVSASNDLIQGNTIANASEAGISTTGPLTNSVIDGNNISGSLYGVMSGNYGRGGVNPQWTGNTFSNNVVRTARLLFYIRSYGSSGFTDPALSAVVFNGNRFVKNTLSDSVVLSYSVVIDFVSDAAGISVSAGNNVISGNNFGITSGSPVLLPPQAFSDGGGNTCPADTAVLTCLAPAPSIAPGGVVPVYSSVNTIQPGEWVSIYGTNLATSTSNWNGDFPKSLGGTSVTIDGKPAYLSFVSPGQINVQAPDDTSAGPVPVVVTAKGGTASSTVTLAGFAPSFFLFDSKHVAGIIVRSNGSGAYGGGTYDILGPTGNSLGYPTVAAKAGDSLELFAVGLGPTNPAVKSGQVFSGAAPATNPVSLLINNVSVTPLFAGLSGAGLYQLNVVIPPGLGTGDVPLVASVGGVRTPLGVVISLR